MLNTGATLRKCWESHYAVFRRLLISNPAASNDDLLHGLELIRGRSTPIQAITDAVYRLERHRHGWETPPENYSPYLSDVGQACRQCPRCSGVGYHTIIYEVPWLTRCPVHRDKLTEHCPVCRKPWPTIKELGARQCEWCGPILSLDALSARRAFAEIKKQRDLSLLYYMISPACPAAGWSLHKNAESNIPTYPGLKITDPFYPTVAATFDRRLSELCSRLSIKCFPCKLITAKS